MSRRSQLSPLGLLGRQLAANRGASIAVAAIVLVTSFLMTAAPRALERLFTAEVQHSVSDVSASQRDLVATAIGFPLAGAGDSDLPPALAESYGAMDQALATLRSGMKDPLHASVAAGRYLTRTATIPMPATEPERDAPIMTLALAIDPRFGDEITIAEGRLPEASIPEPDTTDRYGTVEITLSTASAEAMRWTIGEQRTTYSFLLGEVTMELAGTFEPVDPRAGYWQHNDSIVDPRIFDDGNNTPEVTATGFVNPADLPVAAAFAGDGTRTTAWFPVSAERLDFGEAAALLQQLREFTVGPIIVAPTGTSTDQLSSLAFSSGLLDPLESAVGRAQSTTALLAMAAAGPLGVTLAVLALGARLVIERRRAGLSLAAARGASRGQVRAIMAIEGLILGVPAAIIGALLAVTLVPAAVGPEPLLLPALLGFAPALLLGAVAGTTGMRTTRNDLGEGRRGRFGWIVEVVVLALAALAVFLLLRRGLVTSASGVAVDPLLAATPLLLALAVCVIVLRVYPIPLVWLERTLRARPGLTGYLGSARAVREPAAGLAPVLALVVGVSVAVFSSSMIATLDRGVDAAARATVGADLQARGPLFTPVILEAIAQLDGVTAVAGIDDAGPTVIRVNGERDSITLLVADFTALREVRGSEGLPESLETKDGEKIPVIASNDLVEEFGSDPKLLLEGVPITVAATADRTTGMVTASRWMMVDESFSQRLLTLDFRPRLALVELSAGASSGAVAQAIAEAGGPTTSVLDPAQAAADIRASPAVSGLAAALTIAMVLVLLLCAIAVIMTSVVGARARNRLLALLATLGLSARQARGLAAWEIAPVAITAIVAGVALGLAMPWVILGGVDLRPFTGGASQPEIAIAALPLVAIIVGFAAVVLLAVGVAVAIGRRVSAATTLRMGEEG